MKDDLVHKTSLTPPLSIDQPVPIKESERSCICVLGYHCCLFLLFLYWILEFFRQYGIFCYKKKTNIGIFKYEFYAGRRQRHYTQSDDDSSRDPLDQTH